MFMLQEHRNKIPDKPETDPTLTSHCNEHRDSYFNLNQAWVESKHKKCHTKEKKCLLIA